MKIHIARSSELSAWSAYCGRDVPFTEPGRIVGRMGVTGVARDALCLRCRELWGGLSLLHLEGHALRLLHLGAVVHVEIDGDFGSVRVPAAEEGTPC